MSARFVAANPACLRERLDLAGVHRFEERLPRREVPVKRADPDVGPLGDVLERR